MQDILSEMTMLTSVQLFNRELQQDWCEDCLIGKIIFDHREALVKAYPPYVNFFEQMKETLQQCDNQNPRFHAFLKINQAKPECGRQSLQDLMIRPVQRLPSMSLLISGKLRMDIGLFVRFGLFSEQAFLFEFEGTDFCA